MGASLSWAEPKVRAQLLVPEPARRVCRCRRPANPGLERYTDPPAKVREIILFK